MNRVQVMRLPIAAAFALWAALAPAEPVAITGATVHTLGPLGSLEGATVLIDDGVVRAVGVDINVPASARRIDAAGRVVTPGLFDAYSQLGLVEVSLVPGSDDSHQSGERFTAGFDVADAINPASTLIPINRIEGVTRAMVAPRPGSAVYPQVASLFSGLGSVIHLGGAEDFLVVRRAALFATLGESGGALSGGSRAQALLEFREALEDTRDFDANRGQWASGNRRAYAYGRLDLESLVPVLAGDMPVVVTAQRKSDIEVALRLKKEFRLQMVILGGAEAWAVADQLAAAGVGVILKVERNLPSSFDALGSTLANAARLHAAGVIVAITTADTHNSRNLKQQAGIAVANGLPWEAALRAITVNPARLFGLEASLGTLAPGKVADVVVWDGDPLEVTTFADHVFIAGREMPMVSRQTLLRDRYQDDDSEWPPAYRHP